MKLVVANWKMNKSRDEAATYARIFGELIGGVGDVEIALAPPHPFLLVAADPAGRWSIAGQDCASESDGAFTGEVSASMLASCQCRYVILGHSERRRDFGENEPILARKLSMARASGLVPIFCVGEQLSDREGHRTFDVLRRQLEALAADPPDHALVVAYEPIWAIGTGRNATVAEAEETMSFLVGALESRRDLRVLYGGSVNASNVRDLSRCASLGGYLVGGASLDPAAFAAICRAAA